MAMQQGEPRQITERRLELMYQASVAATFKPQRTAFANSLKQRAEMYRRLPEGARKRWRENDKDPVMHDAWSLLLELADVFQVRIIP